MNKVSWKSFHTVVDANLSRLYLFGPPGVGKSYISDYVMRSHGSKEPYQVTLSEDLTVQEIVAGHWVPADNKFIWNYAPIAKAMIEGAPLIINELSRASAAVQDMLLAVMDDPAIACLTLPNGERIKPASGFRVICTANTPPDDLDEALRDRFDATIKVSTPHPGLISKLNELMRGMGDFIADSYKDSAPISPRKAFAFMELANHCGPEEASRIIFSQQSDDVLAIMRSRGVAINKPEPSNPATAKTDPAKTDPVKPEEIEEIF